MRHLSAIVVLTVVLLTVSAATADAQGLLDPRREAKSMINANLGYGFLSGHVGDSLQAGPGIEASYQYQLSHVPVRVGVGARYSRHGLEDSLEGESVDGSSNKWSAFALGSLLLFGDDTDMIPYVQGRLGYTRFHTTADGVKSNRGGLELSALVGVDVPVLENVSIDVSGLFSWISTGDVTVEGNSIPGTSESGSVFAIRGGAYFFF